MPNAYLPRVLIYNWQLHRSPEGPPLQKKKYRDPVRIWKKETNLEGICSCTLWADALIHCNSFQAACVHRLTQLIKECFHSWNLGFNLGAQVGDSLGSIKGHLETNLIQIVSLSGPEEPCPRLQISAWRWQTPRWLFAWCNHHSHCLKSPHFCQSPDSRHVNFFTDLQLPGWQRCQNCEFLWYLHQAWQGSHIVGSETWQSRSMWSDMYHTVRLLQWLISRGTCARTPWSWGHCCRGSLQRTPQLASEPLLQSSGGRWYRSS